MKSIFFLLPLLGALTLAQDISDDNCQCPQVKCRSDDAAALCQCINGRERRCKERCPKYSPTYKYCPMNPAPTPAPVPKSSPTATPAPKPPTCECEEVYCPQIWPQSCHCANDVAQRCYEKCGGDKPVNQTCSTNDISTRAPEPESVPEPRAAKDCECEQVFCIMMWPDGCYCQHAAAEKCHKKCGGKKPKLQECPPLTSKTLRTKTITRTRTKTPKPALTTSSPPKPTNTHKVCGGGRANYQTCDEGDVCITDPYTPGCGPACDGLGICVKDKLCGGFAGFDCDEKGQVCHDDPRDDCDPMNGGADCGGLCVWPHKSLYDDQQ